MNPTIIEEIDHPHQRLLEAIDMIIVKSIVITLMKLDDQIDIAQTVN